MSLLLAILQALVLFAAAPLLSGITRVARARMHNRRGPGVLQEYRDLFKLLSRQSVAPDAAGWVFRLTPFVMVGVMLTIATALPVVTVGSPLPALGDLITLIYLFAIARFFFALGVGTCILKDGENGSWLIGRDGGPQHIAPWPVEAVDTTGCGDSYCGGFIAALARGLSVKAACDVASAVAALVATGMGSDAGVVDWEQTQAFMAAHRP